MWPQLKIWKIRWPQATLMLSAVFHLVAGIFLVCYPAAPFQWFGVPTPEPLIIEQAFGLASCVLAIAFAVAAIDPFRQWLIVLFGAALKVVFPLAFLVAASQQLLPWSFGWLLIATDLLWLAPFATVIYAAWNLHADTARDLEEASLESVIQRHVSQRGASLHSLSEDGHLLVIFIRHAGCTFCREMLSDLASQRARLEAQGVELAIVHMSSPLEAAQLAIRYGLEGIHLYSDPQCELYEAFGLERGSITQLFGPKVWMRGVWAGLIEGHGVGKMSGDGFRLQGAFVMRDGEVVVACRAQTAADPIDFVSLCKAAKSMQQTTTGELLKNA